MPPQTTFDVLAHRSRRGLGRLVGALALAGPALLAAGGAGARKKKKGKKPCRPARAEAVVASDCFHSATGASSKADELGFPFVARRGGRLDRVEVTALGGPGGDFALEVRDLNQGQGISTAPVLAAARVTLPALASGERRVTGRFGTGARLVAGDSYGLVVRFLGGDNNTPFRLEAGGRCAGDGVLLNRSVGEAQFTPVPGFKLEHTVYVVP